MASFDLCESKQMADDNNEIKKISIRIAMNDVIAQEAYRVLKEQIDGDKIEDILEN